MKTLMSIGLIAFITLAAIILYPLALHAFQRWILPADDIEPDDESDPGPMPVILDDQVEEDDFMTSLPFFQTCPPNQVPGFCPINSAINASTANFSLWEFHSKDGTVVPKCIRGNIQLLMNELQVLRDYFGKSITISSGYRSIAHNTDIKGASQSRHMCGMAADLSVSGHTAAEVQQAIEHLISTGQMKDGGLGYYGTFTHYDIGPPRRFGSHYTLA